VLVEGFKKTPIPKLEVHRQERAMDLLAQSDDSILAVAADYDVSGLDIPVFDLNDIPQIADFIWKHTHA
jgi:molybdopterin-guanine dinucleotide biosynthesis protein MobB